MKFIPLSFLIACFYWKIEKTLSIEKLYNNKSKKSLSQELLLEVSLFWFHFVSALQYLDRYYDEYTMKQTASLNTIVALETFIFSVFFYFWKDRFSFF